MKNSLTSPAQEPQAGACAHTGDAAAYLADELDAAGRARFERHLALCAACRQAVEATRRTLAALKAEAPCAVSRDLAPEIVTRARRAARQAGVAAALWRMAPRAAAAAAAVLLAVGGSIAVWTLHRSHGSRPVEGQAETPDARTAAAAQDALAWLCRTQERDGSWSAAAWGGDRRFEVALTALSVLALVGGAAPERHERLAAARTAAAFLCRQQRAAGEFGPAFREAPYNHALATLALLRAYPVLRDEALRRPLDAALEVIRARQSHAGGWGYLDATTDEANLSISLWHVEALKLAVAQGWADARPSLQRGVQWIAGRGDDSGLFGYRRTSDFPEGPQTLTAMGAMCVLDAADARMIPPARRVAIRERVREAARVAGADTDYYRVYFLTAALQRMREEDSRRWLAALRVALVGRQVQDGADGGSWPANDRWGGTGGRLYATAMASLALQ
jgi:hypothetical protein